ncbi:NmrA/HSCARG family protein [Actinomadura scrupuli]|uniref:NmrA/HSCARG family protein n=1 Tax=Actinomadura scrupuli TaxID=559629 RepID=UPI003D975E14
MTTEDRVILVIGATGLQGGATAARLLADGWRVRALTRSPSGPAALALARAGAEVVGGDLDDRASLDAAVRGAYGVFSVQAAGGFTPGFGAGDEVRQGRAVADAAQAAGVRHLVYTSVGGADRGTGIPSWESKWEIERHIRAIGLPATVLRPVMFMENPASRRGGVRPDGTLAHIFAPDRPVQLIAVDDIGVFAALAFADPGGYLGTSIELAGDVLTFPEIAAAIGAAIGRVVTYRQLPAEALLGPGDARVTGTKKIFNGSAPVWQADIAELRTRHPGLLDFGTWLSVTGKSLIEAHLAG